MSDHGSRDTTPFSHVHDGYERSLSIRGILPSAHTYSEMSASTETQNRSNESTYLFGNVGRNANGVINESQYDYVPVDASEHGTTQMRAFWNSLKVFAGAGTFALPWGFDQSGIGLGMIVYISMAVLCYYVMRMFLKKGTEEGGMMSYYQLCGKAFGKKGHVLSEILVVILIFAVVTSYWILGGSTLAPLVGVEYRIMVLIMLPVYMTLCFLPSLHSVAFASALGALSLLVGMTVVLVIGFGGAATWEPFAYSWFNWEGLPLFAGTTAFLFFVLPGLLPVAISTKSPKKYPNTLGSVFMACGLFNIIFAVLCEALTQPNMRTQQNIIDNMPNGIPRDIVRATLGLEMLLTFPVVMETIFQAVETEFLVKLNDELRFKFANKYPLLTRNIFRTIIIGIIFVIALFVTDFGLFTSLVGSLLASHSTLSIPSFVILKLQGFRATPWHQLGVCILSILFASAMSVFGTYSAISGMLNSHK